MVKKLSESHCFIAGDGTHLREILHPRNGDEIESFSLAHAFLRPGEASLPHRLKQSSETYYILHGNGFISVDGTEYEIEQNDTVIVPANALQSVRNTGDTNLSFLCIVSPPWSAEEEEVDAIQIHR